MQVLANKKQMCVILGDLDVRTLNKLINRGIIPGPLPGSQLLVVSATLAALEKAATLKSETKP